MVRVSPEALTVTLSSVSEEVRSPPVQAPLLLNVAPWLGQRNAPPVTCTVDPWCGHRSENARKVDAPLRTTATGSPVLDTWLIPPTVARAG
jgi:hypothetical protein